LPLKRFNQAIMTEIRFYHLQQDTAAKAIPEILGKAVERGMKVLFKLPSEARCKFYDECLWRFQPLSFLPHGREGDPHGDQQPIWITTQDTAPNQATMALVTENAELPPVDKFDLICLVFDSENQDGLEKARQLWGQFKKQPELTLTYWQQQLSGAWAKQNI
jgi:DNA polymerase III subunit chi